MSASQTPEIHLQGNIGSNFHIIISSFKTYWKHLSSHPSAIFWGLHHRTHSQDFFCSSSDRFCCQVLQLEKKTCPTRHQHVSPEAEGFSIWSVSLFCPDSRYLQSQNVRPDNTVGVCPKDFISLNQSTYTWNVVHQLVKNVTLHPSTAATPTTVRYA